MGVLAGFLTLILPLTAMGIIPPSPFYPGKGPLPDAPPPLIPIDHQRCVAMKRETSQVQVPVPYFCHPRDPKGIPFPKVLDQEIVHIIMRLQWSGYSVCTRQVSVPQHRYLPVPVCCPGWQRGPTGKCDMPRFRLPPALMGPCLNGGMLKKNGKCCQCPLGFTGAFCQHTVPPPTSTRGSPFPALSKMNPASRVRLPAGAAPRRRPPMTIIPALRERIAQLLGPLTKPDSSSRLPISPSVVKVLTEMKNQMEGQSPRIADEYRDLNTRPSRLPVQTAYINQLPPVPARPTKSLVNTESINKMPQRPRPNARPPVNTAYINQMPQKPSVPRKAPVTNVAYINQLPRRPNVPRKAPINTAYINQPPQRPSAPRKAPVNIAYINKVPRRPNVPRKAPVNIAAINQMPRRPSVPRKIPVNIAYINQLPQRRVLRPRVNANINPFVNPRPLRITVNTANINRASRINPRPQVPVQAPRQTAHINRLPNVPPTNSRPPTMRRVPPNSPRPVMAPPVAAAPTLGINPMPPQPQPQPQPQPPVKIQPQEPRSRTAVPPAQQIPRRPMSQPQPQPQPQVQPGRNTPSGASEDQCKKILEVGVTRCFRDAGITAAPRDVFNPQNPDVAHSICSQGGRLRPCIMAGETACGRGMRVIITRRMLASLLSAMGNLCTSRPMAPPIIRKACINGGFAVTKEGKHLCQCPDGFGGEICEIPICMKGCENNGLCENVDGTPRCVCSNGFYGEQCENAVAVTTVTDPKPVDPPTDSLETSPNPGPVPVKRTDRKPKDPDHAPTAEKIDHDTHVAKMELFGYPLWFVLAIVLGFFVFLLVIFVTCCACLKCRHKRRFEVTKEAVKLPIPTLDNVYTVGVVPPVYEAKGIPPLSYEEAKGETIKGLAKQLETNEEEEEADCKTEEK